MPSGQQTSDAVDVPAPVAPGRLPVLGHAAQLWRRPIAFLESLRQVGEVVRVDVGNWPLHVLSSPEFIHKVLVGDAHEFGRGRIFERLRPLFGNGLAVTDGEFHWKQRRLMQPAFHRDRIAAYSLNMCALANAMSESWHAGRTVLVDREVRNLTLSIVARTVFSGDLGSCQRWPGAW